MVHSSFKKKKIKCPKCGSTNLIGSPRIGEGALCFFLCFDCGTWCDEKGELI
jgi:transposase-like protein